jgi:hypothetical protein
MKMGATKGIGSIEHRGEVYICPVCGYTDGWHVSFKFADAVNFCEVYLICPNCHGRFRTGWMVQMESLNPRARRGGK